MVFSNPVGHRISTALGQPMLLGAIGKHGPYFGPATLFALEYDVPPIRRPGRKILPSLVMGELGPAFAGNVHDVDVLTAWCAGTVLAVPGKSQELPVRRPGWRGRVATVCQALHAGSIRVHHVDLRQAGAAAAPGNLRVGLGVPGGRNVRSLEGGYLFHVAAIGIGGVNLRIARA